MASLTTPSWDSGRLSRHTQPCGPLPSTGELNETECDKQTCECDKSVALCLKNQTYREQYRGYLNIYCQGPTPNCSIYDPLPEEITCGHHPPVTLAPP
jgi:secretory phospholipase A2